MIEYELFYLVGESREHDLDKIKKEVDEVVSKEGGKILEVEVVTRRKMSYEIKRESRGVYITKRFEILDKDEREEQGLANKDIVSDINIKLLQNRDVLRFLITRADQLPALGIGIEKDDKSEREKQVLKKEEVKKEEKVKIKKGKKKKAKKAKKKSIANKEEKPFKEKKKREKREKVEEDIDEKLNEILNI